MGHVCVSEQDSKSTDAIRSFVFKPLVSSLPLGVCIAHKLTLGRVLGAFIVLIGQGCH